MECCKNKDLVNELFADYFKQKQREDTGEEGKEADELVEEWLKIILKHLDVADEKADYIRIHCPFHPPDNKPSFVIYKNTYLAVDFHDWQFYRLKDLAEKLGIELPRGKRGKVADKIKELGLDKYGITPEELNELSLKILDIEEKNDGKVVVKGVKHGAFANWLREKFHFATNAITEEIWRYDEGEGVWKPDGEAFIKNLCEKVLIALGFPEFATIRRIAEIVHHIKRHPIIYPDQFNRAWKEGWINCKNGVLNIYTGEFKTHDPKFFFTWRINAEYNPEAKGEVIEHFLNTVSEDREILEEIIAYTLVPGQPFKKFFVLLGPTDTGKSTFIYLIESFLGKENCSNVALQQLERNRFAPSELVGKLANLFADLPPTKLDACPVLKAITGEDTIYVEKKFQKGYFTKIDAKLIFSANMLPEVDESDAFWNRVVIIRFPYRFPKNEKFKEELTKPEERSALLNIVLRAIPRLFEKKFESGDINKAVRLWKLASDPLSVFIDECVEIWYTADDDFIDSEIYEFKGDVFDAFKRFCAKYGVESKYASDYNLFIRQFTKKLADRGVRLREGKKERDGKRLKVWWGIRVKRDDDEDGENHENDKTQPPDNTDSSNSSETGDTSFDISDALGLGNTHEELDDRSRNDVETEEKEESEKTKEDKTNINLDEIDKQILECYKIIAPSVPDYAQPEAFAKMVVKKLGGSEDIKERIFRLIEHGLLPEFYKSAIEKISEAKQNNGDKTPDNSASEDWVRVRAIDYVHIRVNGREYRAEPNRVIKMRKEDYDALDDELKGFLVPVESFEDSSDSGGEAYEYTI